ncbi:hypothetical protein GCM10009682_63620 [Luedemannella flava]|uniref:Uncharacterized protein n=1 Tax=Luedemannella flava TaxID=349316 RepID=A0ABN2MU75_9ACTN
MELRVELRPPVVTRLRVAEWCVLVEGAWPPPELVDADAIVDAALRYRPIAL